MRRFRVWIEYPTGFPDEEYVEMPDDASDEECDKKCAELLESMLDYLDTGWGELKDG